MGRKRRGEQEGTTSKRKQIKTDGSACSTLSQYIWIKLEKGVWWPGFVDEQGNGTFFGEEDDVSIPLTQNNWCEWKGACEDNSQINKSIAKLSRTMRKKFKDDLGRIIQSTNDLMKPKASVTTEDTITQEDPCTEMVASSESPCVSSENNLPKPEAPVATEVTITQEDPCTEMVASSESPCVSSENNLLKPKAPVTTEVTITQEDPCTEMVASSESPCVSSENNLPKPEAPVTTEVTITQEDPCTEMVASSESPCVSSENNLPKPEATVTTEVTITQEDPCTEMVASSESPCVSSENNLPKPKELVTTEVTITQEDPCTEMVASSESPCVSEVLLSETVSCRGILCSGLTPDQLKETWMVASENDVQYYREFSPCVTHVVVHTDPVRIATRTVKYFFAIANHCWILDYKWIEDSKQAGHLLPEEDYEIIGDSTTGTKIQRPKASRMTGSSLLTGYEIYCDEKSSKDIDTVTMTKLLLECGGTVARSLSDFSNKHVKQLIVTCTEDDDVTPEDVEKYTEIYKNTGIVTVVRDWVFDSLSLYSVQPLDEYKFTAEENMSEDDENDASDKDSEMDCFGCGDDDEKDPDYADLESESKEEEEYVSDSSGISELFPVQSVSKSVEALRKKRANIITEKEQKPLTVDPYSATGIDPVRVQASKNKDGIRIWDKIHYCLYCGEGFTNITKHYLGPHKQEMEVQRILSLPLKSEKRKLALMKHRNSGDYKHNVEVLKNGTGTLVTWTRKDETTTTAKEYLPCEDCLAFFLDKNLWRHRKICPFRKNDRNQKRLKSQASLLLPSSVVISEGLQRKVLSRMNTDEITMVVRNDPVILRIGEKLFQKHGHLPHLYPHVSQKMRELGRFLISVRKQDTEINSLSDVLVPKNFPLAVNATRKLCGYVEENNKYSNPSLKIGHLLKKCAKVKKAMSLISADTQSGSNADAFLTLCESEWSDDVSIAALQTLSSEKRNKGSILPLTEDIIKIQRFLKEKSSSLTAGMEEKFSKQSWDMLNQVTLASVVLFNRRRGGETERITLKNYLDGKKNPTSSLQEIEDSLSPVEKMLCDTFERVEIRGKKGRTVPVLLTPCLIKNIDCLMKYREESGVSKENPYLFPRSSFESLNPIRSADCLRRFAQDARLEKPENLTSTQLRKHVATISQVLNLSKSDLENMANFLGHDIEIHRSFYRIPQQTLEIAKMGRLLTAFDNGTVSKYSGKTLDEIPVDDVEELQLDGNISSDDCFESDSEKVMSGHQLFDCSKKGNGCSSSTKKEKVKLSTCQSDTLRREFQEKINLQTELKHEDCMKAINKYSCLQPLGWKKIKNTIHNWITQEKRRTKTILKQKY